MRNLLKIFAIFSLTIAYSQTCDTPWDYGNTYNAGEQVSHNHVNYVACQWAGSGIYPGSASGHASAACGWDASASQSTIWREVGPCTGGTSFIAISSSSFQQVSSSSLTYSSSNVVYSHTEDTTSVSSSEGSSSSSTQGTSFSDNNAEDEAIIDRQTIKRCQISGQTSNDIQSCLDPQTLEGSIIQVPGNITRIDKNGLSVCQIVDEEPRPTVVFFILDQSGSMGGNGTGNDPSGIAAEAFEDAIEHLASLDSTSHVGFTGFSSDLIDSTYVEPAQLSPTHIQLLKNKIIADYASGTHPFNALVKANTDLAHSKYDGYNKAIVILNDGDIGDTRDEVRSAVALGVPVHGIYLNSNGSDPGQTLQDLVTDAPSGTFNRIYQPSDVLPIMESLINNLIQVQTPSSVSISNTDLGISGTSDINSLTQQADSSWKLPLDKDIPLQPGKNNISLITTYSSNGGFTLDVPVNFQIELLPETLNDDIPIDGTVFSSTCYEWARLEIQNPEDQLETRHINQEFDSIRVYYRTIEPGGQGDSILLKLTTLHYLDTLEIYVPRQSDSNGLHEYWMNVPIDWNVEQNLANQILELSAVDSVYALWEHPVDKRDNAYTKSLVFWGLPTLSVANFYDRDGNGKMDSVGFEFRSEVLSTALPYLDFDLSWLDNNQQYFILSDSLWNMVVDPEDSLKAYALPSEDQLGYLTGFHDTLGVLILKHLYPDSSVLQDTTFYNLKTKDYMSPVLYSASADFEGNSDENSKLLLKYTEPLQGSLLRDQLEFEFTNQSHRDFQYDSSQVEVISNQRSSLISYGSEYGEVFRFLPKDSMRLAPTLVEDLAGNFSREDHTLIPIKLKLALNVDVKDYTIVYDEDTKDLPKHTMESYDLNSDINSIIEERGAIAVGLGPFRGNEVDSLATVENTKWDWEVQIFDNIGQFVVNFKGVIKCDDEAFKYNGASNCMDSEGIQFIFTWNNKTNTNRLVGSGVYIMRVRVSGQDDLTIPVGVRRATR